MERPGCEQQPTPAVWCDGTIPGCRGGAVARLGAAAGRATNTRAAKVCCFEHRTRAAA